MNAGKTSRHFGRLRRERRLINGRCVAALAVLVAAIVAAPSAGATVTLPPGSIPIPESGTFLYMNSQPGDYIGGGTEQLYTSAD